MTVMKCRKRIIVKLLAIFVLNIIVYGGETHAQPT